MTGIDLTYCAFPGCHEYGVFDGTDDDGRPAKFCFTHDPQAVAALADGGEVWTPGMAHSGTVVHGIETATNPDMWHEDVVAGLAAILLDHTAMALDTAPDATEAAMRSLAAATGMTLDMAAGLLIATSWMAAAGDLTGEALSEGAEVFEREAEGGPIGYEVVDQYPTNDGYDDDYERCEECGSDDVHFVVGAGWVCHACRHESAHPVNVGFKPCMYCDSQEHDTAEHLELYPLPVRKTGTTEEDGSPDDIEE